jgi:hypothetical protein
LVPSFVLKAAHHPLFHRPLVAVPLFLAASGIMAQSQDNRAVKRILLDRDTIQVDSLSIVPGSLTLWNDSGQVALTDYVVDPYHALIIRNGGSPTDSLTARYRVMPLRLAGPFRHKDPKDLVRLSGDREDPFKYVPGKGTQDLFGAGGMNKSGSISRGILFGNNQDLSVNSTLNLELNGHLTDKIDVQASVTDNNIPIQAGGNTQEIQDFDQVFIKLHDDHQELIAGDFVLQRPKSHFLNYYKKTKGLSYTTRLGRPDGTHDVLGVSAAISKGDFARDQIKGIEGVQGPYRLTASDGGTFIIVLSGTERVYLDGQLLTRGLENDYVIDYNTAELTFTARRLITKDRRITVEFQYSDKNYVRSLVRVSNELLKGATALRFDLYSEQDHKGQPLQQDLTDAERQALALAGDDPLAAVVSGADSVAYSADEVLYAKIDSLGFSPVYRYSTNTDSARYRVSFSNVGAGNGDYMQQEFTPNGRVFRWLAPQAVNGTFVHFGDHAPVRVLVPARSQRMVAVGADHRFSARAKAWGEVAVSDADRNTFSSADDGDNTGLAVKAGASNSIPLDRQDTAKHLVLGTDNEWRSKDFTVIERYRPVEFERDWNITTVPQDGDQLLSKASIGLFDGKHGTATLSSSLFHIDQRYDGFRQALLGAMQFGRFSMNLDGSLLNTSADSTSSDFLRHKAQFAWRFKPFTIGLNDEQERNRFHDRTSGILALGSYQFQDWEAFLQNPDSVKTRFRLGAGQRYDKGLRNGKLAPSTEATNYNATIDLSGAKVRKLSATFTYRQLRIIDSSLAAQPAEDTYLARLDHAHSAWKGALSWDMFYEFGSGLEQKSEYIYVQVPTGQGTYVWHDYNGDGVKDLNEFETANFDYEADYIRVFVPTTETVRVFSNQLSASGELRPSAVWREAKGLRGFLSKWNDVASFRSDRKTGDNENGSAFNPFIIDPLDTSLIALNSSARNTVYFDRSSRTWSIDHTYQSDRSKSLLLNGSESRLRESNLIHLRWNTTDQWTFEIEAGAARTVNTSDLTVGQTWSIAERSGMPKLTWQPHTRLRGILFVKYVGKRNKEEFGGEQAEVRTLGAEFRFNSSGKGSLQLTANLVDITYNGLVDSSLGTEMLSGLKPGTNATWSATLQRRLSDHLQVDLTYNGRSSPGTSIVHVGGAQVRAFF